MATKKASERWSYGLVCVADSTSSLHFDGLLKSQCSGKLIFTGNVVVLRCVHICNPVPKPLQWWRKPNLTWWQDKIWAEAWLASCCSSTSHYNNINFCVAYLCNIYCKRHTSFPKQFIFRFYRLYC